MFPDIFKAAYVGKYEIDSSLTLTEAFLEEKLKGYAHRPLDNDSAMDISVGFVSPYGEGKLKQIEVAQGYYFGVLMVEKKKIKTSEQNRLVKQAIKKHAEIEGVSPDDYKKDKAKVKGLEESVKATLIKRTLPTEKKINFIIDTNKKLLIVDSPSEASLKIVSEKLSSAGVVLKTSSYFESELKELMTEWAYDIDTIPSKVTVSDKCKVALSGDDESRATFVKQDIFSQEIKESIAHGKRVVEMQLLYDGGVEFLLNYEGVLKSMKYTFAKKENDSEDDSDKIGSWLLGADRITSIISWVNNALNGKDEKSDGVSRELVDEVVKDEYVTDVGEGDENDDYGFGELS